MPAKSTIPIDTEVAQADAAAAHDAWFRSEVEAGLREADDPNCVWIPHEEINRRCAVLRAELEKHLPDEQEAAS
jgi:hypothetical protein